MEITSFAPNASQLAILREKLRKQLGDVLAGCLYLFIFADSLCTRAYTSLAKSKSIVTSIRELYENDPSLSKITRSDYIEEAVG